ncbi:MAG: DUF4397 domain-containing protein [Phycisphaerae bacterium]|nr:DUF4397 domain-containing protein [Phycisphaerae bacterium]
MKKTLVFLCAAAVLGVCGCAESLVRVAHLSPDAPGVDVWLDGDRALQDVIYKNVSKRIGVTEGEHELKITPAGQAQPVLLRNDIVLEGKNAYTVAVTGQMKLNNLAASVLTDKTHPDDARTTIRFYHGSPDAPGVDIARADGAVLFRNVSFREQSGYLSIEPGTYTLVVNAAGTDNVVLTLPGATFESGAVYTLYATGLVAENTLTVKAVKDAPIPRWYQREQK